MKNAAPTHCSKQQEGHIPRENPTRQKLQFQKRQEKSFTRQALSELAPQISSALVLALLSMSHLPMDLLAILGAIRNTAWLWASLHFCKRTVAQLTSLQARQPVNFAHQVAEANLVNELPVRISQLRVTLTNKFARSQLFVHICLGALRVSPEEANHGREVVSCAAIKGQSNNTPRNLRGIKIRITVESLSHIVRHLFVAQHIENSVASQEQDVASRCCPIVHRWLNAAFLFPRCEIRVPFVSKIT
mmetsp:Transcript_23828/g.52500  ORF Transcript_23828/g.52500 Transcript_23828/m.52500 type:complete len:246 (-) Transcript_23828:619-1356(-)